MFKSILRYLFYLTGTFLIVLIFLFLGLKVVLDQKSIKSLVNEKIQHYLKLDVEYNEIGSVVFPRPGFEFKGLKVRDGIIKIGELERILVTLDIFSLLKKEFKINTIQLEDGQFFVERLASGEFALKEKFKTDNPELEQGQEIVEEGPHAVFLLLPHDIIISNVKIVYSDKMFDTSNEFLIKTLNVNFEYKDYATHLNLLGSLDENPLELYAKVKWIKNEWSKDSMRIETRLKLNDFALRKVNDFGSVFPLGDFNESTLDLNMALDKLENDKVSLKIENLSFDGLKTIKGKPVSGFKINSDLFFISKDSFLQLNKVEFIANQHTQVALTGVLDDKENRKISTNINSERIDLAKLQPIIDIFSNIDLNSSRYFAKKEKMEKPRQNKTKKKSSVVKLDLDMKNLNLNGKFISYINGPILINDDMLTFDDLLVGIFDGKVKSKGKFNLLTKDLFVESNLSRINVEKAIASATNDKLLKGSLNGDARTSLNLKKTSNIMGKIRLNFRFFIGKGRLIGYANFIKPVAEVGKLLNFNAAKGDSTEFESIRGDIFVSNHTVNLKSFEMKGIGLSAIGSGVYNESKKIDMKFTVSLSGLVGKAIKLPIIYKGFYGKNFAYIDPVWLASVYAGTLLLGGPAGAILGGLAGSTASDTVDKTIGTVKDSAIGFKNFLFGEDKKNQHKKKK